MGPVVPSALPALWALGCVPLLLWLWMLCTACHRKPARRQRARLQGRVMPVEVSLLRRTQLCSFSKSDSRLHELHRGPHHGPASRPASMDLLCPHRLEVPRDAARLQEAHSAFLPQLLPRAPPTTTTVAAMTPSIGPEATYSNVGLAAIPRASLAASPMVWAGTWLTVSCAGLGPGASPVVAEYACIQKHKRTDQGPQEQQQGKARVTPDAQVDILYSRVCKPKSRRPGPATDQLDARHGGAPLASGSDLGSEAAPLRGWRMDPAPPENVYESVGEMGLRGWAPPLPSATGDESGAPRPPASAWEGFEDASVP